MRQLSLFPGDEAPAPEVSAEAEPAEEPVYVWPDVPEVLPGQLHLFSDRAVRLGRARKAIAEAKLDIARRELATLAQRFPDDRFIVREASRASALHRRLRKALGSPPEGRAAALLALVRSLEMEEPWASLRLELTRRAGVELRLSPEGDAAELEGLPPGAYLLAAGAFEDARVSLAGTLALRQSGRAAFLLGDASFLLGDPAGARRVYLYALLLDPFDKALENVRDEAVRTLPDVVRYELEIEDDPAAWCAPAGIVTGVLPSPVGLPFEAITTPAGREGSASAAAHGTLERARAFVRAMVEASSQQDGEGVIAARRKMKQLSAPMFAAYIESGGAAKEWMRNQGSG